MREYLYSPGCRSKYCMNIRELHEFLTEKGLKLKSRARISGFGKVIGDYLIDPDPSTGGYYIHHHHALKAT